MTLLARPAALAALFLVSGGAARAATCDFADYRANDFREGACTVSDADPVRPVFTVRGRAVRVEFERHQGPFHRWRLDGRPAAAYELNREAYCAWTDDLSLSFCFARRGPIPR